MSLLFSKLIPTLNRILVKRLEAELKTASGLILKETTDKLSHGEVVEVGPGSYDQNGKIIPIVVQKGDTVLLPEYGGTKITLQTGDYFLFRDTDILGILQK